MEHHDDWHDQERRVGNTAHLGEAAMGALVAIGIQALLSAGMVAGGAVYWGGSKPAAVAGSLSCAAFGQFIWLFPAFLFALWWRPGFAGGLAAGALFGGALGIGLSCLAAIA